MSSVADKQCQNSWQEVTAQITWIYYFHPFYSSSAVCVRRIKWSAIQLFLFARDCGSSLKETLFEFFPASHSPVSQLLTGQGCLWAGKKMPQMPKLILHSFQRTHSGIWMSLVSHGISLWATPGHNQVVLHSFQLLLQIVCLWSNTSLVAFLKNSKDIVWR